MELSLLKKIEKVLHHPSTDFLIVNFGGPRHPDEIYPFLKELLCDQDVVRTKFPQFIHNFLFRKIAHKRSLTIQKEYALIGGKSPIFFDTEEIASLLSEKLFSKVLTFHRYLPKTHDDSLIAIENSQAKEIRVLPLFPQFTYATTGSIARFFLKNLSKTTQKKLRFLPSFPTHPLFIESMQKKIDDFLKENHLSLEETILLFSSHGVPQIFVDTGDPYEKECRASFESISRKYEKAISCLSFQSQFGKGKWLSPSTKELSENILSWNQGRKNVVFIPLSFTSDHIETLVEIEHQYVPLIREKTLNAYRCPALNLEPYWIENLRTLFLDPSLFQSPPNTLIQS